MIKMVRARLRSWGRSARNVLICALLTVGGASIATADVVRAEFREATNRYGHRVLGETPEWGVLHLWVTDDTNVSLRLPHDRVFEDLAPRLVDVTGDGQNEVVVVESHLEQGARLSVYGRHGLITATPYIGRKFRWLAPVALADLDGDGAVELAYIDRPHLAQTLRVWRYKGGQLREVTHALGLTNHRIGWAYIIGGLRSCDRGPEMVLATGDWRNIVALRLVNNRLDTRVLGPWLGPASMAAALRCEG
jgi:hypothetical protein